MVHIYNQNENEMGSHSPSGYSSDSATRRYLLMINQAARILKGGGLPADVLPRFLELIPGVMRFPELATAAVQVDNHLYAQPSYVETPNLLQQEFDLPDGTRGFLKVSYKTTVKGEGGTAFLADESVMLENLGQLLSNFFAGLRTHEERHFTNERLKELAAINQTTLIIKSGKPVPETLRIITSLIPSAWQYSDFTSARITYDGAVFTSHPFSTSEWRISAPIETIDGKQGLIEVFYSAEFPLAYEGPFLKEERDLIENLAAILTGYLNGIKGKEEKYSINERLKELAAINQTTAIVKEKKPIDETLSQIANILPSAWQYPQFASARIRFSDKQYLSEGFRETKWRQSQAFETIDGKHGVVDIFYHRQFPEADEGPFLYEERQLLANLTGIISGYLNGLKGRDAMRRTGELKVKEGTQSPINSRQLLQKFLNRQNYARDVFHDLMPFKVTEILLVATLYDAYIIEKDGRFSETILGEYYQLNLTSVPRITGVSSLEEAMEQLELKHFDLIILMVGVEKSTHLVISKNLREAYPYIPIYVLLNNNSDIHYFESEQNKEATINKVFVWNGDSKIFFAMVKHLEDRVNVENDTRIGMVRVILLVEDSAKYYSRYLPLLYSNVMEQTRRLIEDVNTDELFKILKLRARPKILLASNYEEAIAIFEQYRENMLCVITDVKFNKGGVLKETAGFDLVSEVREQLRDLPIIIQSADQDNSHMAFLHKASFLNKNSETLVQDIKYFISTYLGFGSFVYKDSRGRPIATARTLREFEKLLMTIPDDSLLYHARRNHFSLWFMARGEIQIARIIYPFKLEHFENPSDIRSFLLDAIQQHRNEQNRGKVVQYEESLVPDESNIVALSPGSMGGKGRGLAFIQTLIYNFDFKQLLPNINIRSPRTFIIGTDEFEHFIDRNNLWEQVAVESDYEKVKALFLESPLSETLVGRLRKVLANIDKPLAIRSSGLFEDSLMQPFAGIFGTFLVPNSHVDPEVRLRQCLDAIRLVYASVCSPVARSYIEAINYRLEEERMAVIIQEVVGNRYEDYFYPHISGVAQSYNYYPFAHMKPEEGFAVAALGLGRYVVEGEKAFRFSPKYPTLEIASPKDQLKSSQSEFFAIDMKRTSPDFIRDGEEAGLVRLTIDDAERQGTLRHCVSVFNPDNQSIVPGLSKAGPRIVNFADILKYNYIPLASTIDMVLDVVKEAMGAPVEIEFAVDLERDEEHKSSFYLLQIKPLIGAAGDYRVDLSVVDKEKCLLYSDKAMGNGRREDIFDIVYIPPERFDKLSTVEMAAEIEQINLLFREKNRKYLLIGPGRWGTRDRYIGIPVSWPQISNAAVIVETALEDFPLDASSGSHFFHNVTSMNVGYFSIIRPSGHSFIRYDRLERLQEVGHWKYFRHLTLDHSVEVMMDGRQRMAVVVLNDDS